MNCKKSEIYMMQHFDKTIKPANASKLMKHVLICEKCRELYLTFDESMDFAAENNLTEAPSGFTDSVMAMIPQKKDYSPAVFRAVWAFCAIVFGIVLALLFNPENYYIVQNITGIIDSASVFITSATLLFAAVTGTLLFVLHSGEKAKV
ncbi:MAG: hypothetical protein FWF81_07180 [Defluviitaleaceae bacterium]|nr:hypothetical protein [Defluviitaleaceae bacterium]